MRFRKINLRAVGKTERFRTDEKVAAIMITSRNKRNDINR